MILSKQLNSDREDQYCWINIMRDCIETEPGNLRVDGLIYP